MPNSQASAWKFTEFCAPEQRTMSEKKMNVGDDDVSE
jgi:hypothetical protein